MRRVRTIIINNDDDEDSPPKRWQWFVRPQWADDDGSGNAQERQRLEVHHCAARRAAAALVERLIERPDEARAVVLAAKWHDLGKRRVEWRRSIGINDSDDWWAKSGPNDKQAPWTGYRHEFGSLLDLRSEQEFAQLSPEMQELVLHLVAAHHGRARPHFPAAEVFDFNHSDRDSIALARQIPERFARLQRKYGRWGLAYLESLVRTADALASPGGGFETDSEARIVGAESVNP
jgi:CRISPR-associated endonuclease/helicase Cas3